MKAPLRVAATEEGKLLVSDYQGRKIMLVAPATLDMPEMLFDVEGSPLAIEAVRNFILIGDDTSRTIKAYKYNGELMKIFAAGGPVQASDIAYDALSRRVFVVDTLNHDVKVFKDSGELQMSFGVTGPLYNPKGIAIDPLLQRIFVSDYGDPVTGVPASILIFDDQGALLQRITGNFSRPQGITVDATRIFMVDAMLSQVLVFDRSTNAQIATLGERGVAEGQLMLPMDIHLDAVNGRLLVTNSRLGKLTPVSLATP